MGQTNTNIDSMSRQELISFLESVKAGQVKFKKYIWKLEAGQLYLCVKDDWKPVDKAVYDKQAGTGDIFIHDADADVTYYKRLGATFVGHTASNECSTVAECANKIRDLIRFIQT